jgi:hypothetical protein
MKDEQNCSAPGAAFNADFCSADARGTCASMQVGGVELLEAYKSYPPDPANCIELTTLWNVVDCSCPPWQRECPNLAIVT